MSELLCRGLGLVGALSFSWKSFKVLKTRGQVSAEIASMLALSGGSCAGEEAEESLLNLRLEGHLAKKEMAEILKFWSVFAFLQLYEYYVEIFVFWVPFYYTVKFALLLWMVLPQSRGASVLFESIVEPRLDAQHERIENKFLPSVRARVIHVQQAIAGMFVRVAIHLCSPEQLEQVKDHLLVMADEIGSQQERHRNEFNNVDKLAIKKGEDFVIEGATEVEEHQTVGENVGYLAMASGWMSAISSSLPSAALGGGGNSGSPSVNDEKNEQKTQGKESKEEYAVDHAGIAVEQEREEKNDFNDKKLERSNSVNWVMNAFDGVVGLTVSTKDVLMGRSESGRSLDRLETSSRSSRRSRQEDSELAAFDEIEMEQDFPTGEGKSAIPSALPSLAPEKAAVGASSKKSHQQALNKYSTGFDALSECEDSDGTPKATADIKTVRRSPRAKKPKKDSLSATAAGKHATKRAPAAVITREKSSDISTSEDESMYFKVEKQHRASETRESQRQDHGERNRRRQPSRPKESLDEVDDFVPPSINVTTRRSRKPRTDLPPPPEKVRTQRPLSSRSKQTPY